MSSKQKSSVLAKDMYYATRNSQARKKEMNSGSISSRQVQEMITDPRLQQSYQYLHQRYDLRMSYEDYVRLIIRLTT